MSAAHRVQLSRAKGFKLPADAVNVARPSRWGNPYVIGKPVDVRQVKRWGWKFSPAGLAFVTPDAETARARFFHCLVWDQAIHDHVRKELAGKRLACWCRVDQPCHADVLHEIAESTTAQINALHSEMDREIFAAACFA